MRGHGAVAHQVKSACGEQMIGIKIETGALHSPRKVAASCVGIRREAVSEAVCLDRARVTFRLLLLALGV